LNKVVRNRSSFALALAALLQIVGGHWAILQAGAWMGMIVVYSDGQGFTTAVVQTFDGKHRCPLCRAVERGREKESRKAPTLQWELRKDFVLNHTLFLFGRPFSRAEFSIVYLNLNGVCREPPVPPPRLA
jgi:hypothetical protein